MAGSRWGRWAWELIEALVDGINIDQCLCFITLSMQHLVGNVGHEQGVSAMAVISVAQVGGHCSHNRCHRRKGRLQRKYFKNNSSFYLFKTCPTLSVSPATVGGSTMRRRSLSRTRGRKATRDSGLALPTSLRLATRSPSSSCRI